MKKFKYLVPVLAALLFTTPVVLTSCSTTANKMAYRTVAITHTTVRTAMAGWNQLVKNGNTTVDQELQVKQSYEKYRAAMITICDIGKLYSAGVADTNASQAVLDLAVQEASTMRQDLLDLLMKFGVKVQ